MANARTGNRKYSKVVVDTAPGASGEATIPMSYENMNFFVTGGVGDVNIQFRGPGETDWEDDANGPYTAGASKTIDNPAGLEYQAICKNGDYTSGDLVFGLAGKK